MTLPATLNTEANNSDRNLWASPPLRRKEEGRSISYSWRRLRSLRANRSLGSVIGFLIRLTGVLIMSIDPSTFGFLGCLFAFSLVALVILLTLALVTLRSLLVSLHNAPLLQTSRRVGWRATVSRFISHVDPWITGSLV